MRLIALIFMLYCLYPLHECLGMRHEQELQATRERNGKRKRNTRPLVRDQAKPAAEYDVFDIHAAAQNPGLTFASPPFVSGPSYGAPVTFGGHPDYADGGNLNFGHLNRGSFLPNFGFPDFGNFPRFGSPGAQSQERPYIPPVSKVLKEGINAFLPAGAQKYSNPGISVPSQPTPLEPILKTPGSQNQFDALRQVAVNPLQTAFSAAIKDPSLSPLPFPERKNSKEQTAELTRRVEQDLLAVEKTFTPEEKKTKAVYDKIEGISNPPSIPPIVVSEPRLENKLPVPGDRHKVGEPENYVSHGGFPIRSDSKLSPFQPSPPPAPHTSHASTGITKGGTSPDYGVGQQQDYVSSQKSQETSPQDYVPHQAFPKAAHPGYAAHQTLGTDAPHSPSKILQNEQTAEFVPLQTGPRDTSVEFKSPKIITAENYNDGKQGPILNGQKIPTFTGADLKIERDAFLTPGPKRGEYYPLTRSGGSFPVRNQEILSENQQIEKPTRPEIYDVREASRESSQRESGAYEAPRSSSKFPVIEYKQFAHQPESLSTTEDQHSQVLQSFGLRPLPKPPTTEAPTLFSGTELLSLVQGSHPAKPTAPANDFLTVASTTVQSIRPYLLDPDSDSSLDYDRVEPQKTPTAPTNVFPNDHFKAQSESSHILNTPSVPSAFQVRRQPSPHDKHDVYLNHQVRINDKSYEQTKDISGPQNLFREPEYNSDSDKIATDLGNFYQYAPGYQIRKIHDSQGFKDPNSIYIKPTELRGPDLNPSPHREPLDDEPTSFEQLPLQRPIKRESFDALDERQTINFTLTTDRKDPVFIEQLDSCGKEGCGHGYDKQVPTVGIEGTDKGIKEMLEKTGFVATEVRITPYLFPRDRKEFFPENVSPEVKHFNLNAGKVIKNPLDHLYERGYEAESQLRSPVSDFEEVSSVLEHDKKVSLTVQKVLGEDEAKLQNPAKETLIPALIPEILPQSLKPVVAKDLKFERELLEDGTSQVFYTPINLKFNVKSEQNLSLPQSAPFDSQRTPKVKFGQTIFEGGKIASQINLNLKNDDMFDTLKKNIAQNISGRHFVVDNENERGQTYVSDSRRKFQSKIIQNIVTQPAVEEQIPVPEFSIPDRGTSLAPHITDVERAQLSFYNGHPLLRNSSLEISSLHSLFFISPPPPSKSRTEHTNNPKLTPNNYTVKSKFEAPTDGGLDPEEATQVSSFIPQGPAVEPKITTHRALGLASVPLGPQSVTEPSEPIRKTQNEGLSYTIQWHKTGAPASSNHPISSSLKENSENYLTNSPRKVQNTST